MMFLQFDDPMRVFSKAYSGTCLRVEGRSGVV